VVFVGIEAESMGAVSEGTVEQVEFVGGGFVWSLILRGLIVRSHG